jgi:hypothetical protein
MAFAACDIVASNCRLIVKRLNELNGTTPIKTSLLAERASRRIQCR